MNTPTPNNGAPPATALATTDPSAAALARFEAGDLDAKVFELLTNKRTPIEIMMELRLPIEEVEKRIAGFKRLMALTPGTMAAVAAAAPPGHRVDLVFCGFCDGNQAQHFGGAGRNPVTGCPRFQPPREGT
jgi:hypothetical protein